MSRETMRMCAFDNNSHCFDTFFFGSQAAACNIAFKVICQTVRSVNVYIENPETVKFLTRLFEKKQL